MDKYRNEEYLKREIMDKVGISLYMDIIIKKENPF